MCNTILHGDCNVLKYIRGYHSGFKGRGQKKTWTHNYTLLLTKLLSCITFAHILVELSVTQE